jgi:hypothetical protein
MPKSKTWSEPIRWMQIVRSHYIVGTLRNGAGASHLRRKILQQIDQGNVRPAGKGAYQVKRATKTRRRKP